MDADDVGPGEDGGGIGRDGGVEARGDGWGRVSGPVADVVG